VTRIIEGAALGLTHLLKVNELFWERTNGRGRGRTTPPLFRFSPQT
jgi:hypothetical protein